MLSLVSLLAKHKPVSLSTVRPNSSKTLEFGTEKGLLRTL